MQYNYEPLFDPEIISDYNSFYTEFKESSYHSHHHQEKENNDCPIKQEEYDEWINTERSIATKFFKVEYEQLVKDEVYFYGCPHKLYIKTYVERLNSFLKYYPEASEMHFIKSEMQKGIKAVNYFISDREQKNMSFALEKRFNYLIQRSSQLGYNITLIKGKKYADDTFKISRDKYNPIVKKEHLTYLPLNWNGTNVQAAELIKALIEINMFDPELSEKEIFERFSCFFGKEINKSTGIKDFSKRPSTGGNLTRFLDDLKISLIQWFERKEERNRYN